MRCHLLRGTAIFQILYEIYTFVRVSQRLTWCKCNYETLELKIVHLGTPFGVYKIY